MNILTKAISGALAIGALGFTMNAQSVEKCTPEPVNPAVAGNYTAVATAPVAAPQTQAPYYPAYGYQQQWYPRYYGYRNSNRSWNPWSRDRSSSEWDNRNRWDNNNRWGNLNRWNNGGWGDYDSYVDTFGNMHIDMDFDFEFDWDWDADVDADADIDTEVDSYTEGYGRNDNRFRNRFNNSYYNRYYDGYYGRQAPYNYYYNYQYGYSYPAAPQTAPQTAPAAETAKVDVKPAAPVEPISVDDDKDSVLNSGDFCPNTAAGSQVDSFGCTINEVIILHGVNFHTDSDKLTDESIVILNGVSTTLNAHPELKLEVSGHTDSVAPDDYNKHLSQRRAERVREYLVSKGATAENLTARGYGEERPIASNGTAEGMAQNRRVELNRL